MASAPQKVTRRQGLRMGDPPILAATAPMIAKSTSDVAAITVGKIEGGRTAMNNTGTAPPSENDNAEKIWGWLISNGLSEIQAAGIMGNMKEESSFVPTRRQGRGTVLRDRRRTTAVEDAAPLIHRIRNG